MTTFAEYNRWAPVIGGAPLCDWKPVPTLKGNGEPNTPIIVELFTAPLNPTWKLEDWRHTTITRSVSFNDQSAPEYNKIKDFNDQISAVVVREGPDYDDSRTYKVTLYGDWSYAGNLLPLNLGVYPDLDRYGFGDITSSVKFEQGTPARFMEDYSATRSYYERNV